MFLSGVDYVSIKTVFTKRVKNRTFLCIHVWKETFFTHSRSNGEYFMPKCYLPWLLDIMMYKLCQSKCPTPGLINVTSQNCQPCMVQLSFWQINGLTGTKEECISYRV